LMVVPTGALMADTPKLPKPLVLVAPKAVD
jgi:hypothetical protein